MVLHRTQQQVAVARPLVEHIVVRDDLVLGLPYLYQLSELGRFARLAFAYDLAVRLKQTYDLTRQLRDPVEDPRSGLPHHLPYPVDHDRQMFTQPKAAGALRHPHIVAIYEIGEQDGLFYYSMDFVAGHSLAEIVREHPLPQMDAARCCMLIAGAVDFANSQNTLHRDLKPSNVMVDEQGQPHITDFGLAGSLIADARHSVTDSAVGTPAYMSPEQASGRREELTASSDVYSLGAVLYESLTGRPPFQTDSAFETIRTQDSPVATSCHGLRRGRTTYPTRGVGLSINSSCRTASKHSSRALPPEVYPWRWCQASCQEEPMRTIRSRDR